MTRSPPKPCLLGATIVGIAAAPVASQAPAAPVKSTAEEEAEQRLHTDWAWFGRYREANAALAPTAAPPTVFMGDSITQGWTDKTPGFFTPDRTNRGIGGQTTSQMLLRFRQDVIALKPKAVHIMAGTNDIAGNTGPITAEDTQANIMSMAELARAHGIRVILASIPPALASRPHLELAQTEPVARTDLRGTVCAPRTTP